MIYVYKLPDKLSDGYCFGGGNPITFTNVDWISTPEDGCSTEELKQFFMKKIYYTNALVGTKFLCLCTDNDMYTFVFTRT